MEGILRMFDINFSTFILWVVGITLSGLVIFTLSRMIKIVPAQTAMVIEQLGRYVRTIGAGFHVLAPIIEKVRYKHNLKERAIDIPVQPCSMKGMMDYIIFVLSLTSDIRNHPILIHCKRGKVHQSCFSMDI